LNALDTRDPQVLIEALIVEVVRSNDLERGAVINFDDISIDDVAATLGSSLGVPPGIVPPFSFGVTSDKNFIDATITARKGITRLNILSNPLVSAVSGSKAVMEVIERVPYIKSTNTINVGGGTAATNTSQEIAFEEVGIRMTVTPKVGLDGVIDLEILPEVRELVDFVLGTPVIDQRRVTTRVLVRNNQTVVVGGLLRAMSRRHEDKVPLLGDIPIIGELFKRVEKSNEKVELLVFLTPHLMGYGFEPVDGYQPERELMGEDKRFRRIGREIERQRIR
jgi:general secretion pathway protein D